MSQHHQSFLIDDTGNEFHVARRVLSLLAARDAGAGVGADPQALLEVKKGPACRQNDLIQQLYQASFKPSPAEYARAVDLFRASSSVIDEFAFEIIPEIARQLGSAWENDLISFADVTIGCARLQSTLRQLPDGDGSDNRMSPKSAATAQCLVIVPADAQHTLGALVLAKKLRRAGQAVTVELQATPTILSDLGKEHDFGNVFLSASRSEQVETLRDLVGATRQTWSNSKITIGGSISTQHSDLMQATQADRVTSDCEKVIDLCA